MAAADGRAASTSPPLCHCPPGDGRALTECNKEKEKMRSTQPQRSRHGLQAGATDWTSQPPTPPPHPTSPHPTPPHPTSLPPKRQTPAVDARDGGGGAPTTTTAGTRGAASTLATARQWRDAPLAPVAGEGGPDAACCGNTGAAVASTARCPSGAHPPPVTVAFALRTWLHQPPPMREGGGGGGEGGRWWPPAHARGASVPPPAAGGEGGGDNGMRRWGRDGWAGKDGAPVKVCLRHAPKGTALRSDNRSTR